jgi:hypothetical protein
MAQRVDISDSGVADSNQRSPNATSPHPEQPSSHRLELYDELLAIDLPKHKANVDKLYEFCKALQVLCQEQRSEIAQLRTEAVANLAKSPSTGSTRRETDDSELSQKKGLKDIPEGIAVVFSPSDNGLRILQGRDMKGMKSSSLDPRHKHSQLLQTRITFKQLFPLSTGGKTVSTSTLAKFQIESQLPMISHKLLF